MLINDDDGLYRNNVIISFIPMSKSESIISFSQSWRMMSWTKLFLPTRVIKNCIFSLEDFEKLEDEKIPQMCFAYKFKLIKNKFMFGKTRKQNVMKPKLWCPIPKVKEVLSASSPSHVFKL